jgi:hypothetical protein
MNNTRRKTYNAEQKARKAAGFSKPVFKKKAQNFPQPKDAGISMREQHLMFHGSNSVYAK